MFTLTHLDTPPPESMKSQVLQMVVDYLSDISAVSLTSGNPLYPLYQYVVGFESVGLSITLPPNVLFLGS